MGARIMNAKRFFRVLTVGAVMAMGGQVLAADLGTTFTFQGRLDRPPGTPLTDTCNMRFRLWIDATSTLP